MKDMQTESNKKQIAIIITSNLNKVTMKDMQTESSKTTIYHHRQKRLKIKP